MALDHYVSQVYLRNFYAKALNLRKMYAYRKSDGAQFPCGSEDVCRVAEGSTNVFLDEPRILENFLHRIEPSYNRACDALGSGHFCIDDVVIIAGFAAFVIGTSPTAMRLGSDKLTRLAHTEVELMDRMGMLEPAPAELGGKTASELIQEGALRVDTDVKFPQAMGISGIAELTKAFATFHWEILRNPVSDRFPFVTSDYPTAIEGAGVRIPAVRILALRPDLAVRILPQIRPKWRPDLESDFRFKIRRMSPIEVRKVNLAIVRSAENLVFSSVQASWVKSLVGQNARFRLELEHTRTAKGTGYLLLNSVVVRET